MNDNNLNDRLQMQNDTENEITKLSIPIVFRDKGGIGSVQLADVYSLLNLYCRVQLLSGSSS